MKEKLRLGYTTGTHATAILVAVLREMFEGVLLDTVEVNLPDGNSASIKVKHEKRLCFSTIKSDNDDIDVTKGCKIFLNLYETKPKGLREQNASVIYLNKTQVYVYAGIGVGIVTKKGLKIEPGFPAINPVPLEMMFENSKTVMRNISKKVHAVFSVENGEIISRNTANSKVGVIGGISILGTKGIVKPVSASAYIDSVQEEINVAAAQDEDIIVFTLGNTAFDYAKEIYKEISIVEIGNFIYDATKCLKNHAFKKIVFITSVAKMCKVAQGFKNTHNKFGTIDFSEVQQWIQEELNISLEDEEYLTLKALLQNLKDDDRKEFIELLGYKASKIFQSYIQEIDLSINNIKIVTLDDKNIDIKELKW